MRVELVDASYIPHLFAMDSLRIQSLFLLPRTGYQGYLFQRENLTGLQEAGKVEQGALICFSWRCISEAFGGTGRMLHSVHQHLVTK